MVESRDVLCSGRCFIQWHLCSFLWWETSEIAVQHVYQHEEVVNGSIKGWSSDQGRDIRKMLRPRVPCHNRSYLSVGGEWIPSMNNRLSLIFLGEPRPPISQLISGFLIFYLFMAASSCERDKSITQPVCLFLCPVKNCKMLSGSWKPEKCQWGKMSQCLTSAFLKYGHYHKKLKNRWRLNSMTVDVIHWCQIIPDNYPRNGYMDEYSVVKKHKETYYCEQWGKI